MKYLIMTEIICQFYRNYLLMLCELHCNARGRRGHDRMVVGFTTTYAISAYHH